MVHAGSAEILLPEFCRLNSVNTVVCDFSPTRIAKKWKSDLVTSLKAQEEQEQEQDASINVVKVIEVSDTYSVSNYYYINFIAKTCVNALHCMSTTYFIVLLFC
jgi:hypothetical protein